MVSRVAVLGGGLQGAAVALELVRAGVAVDVFDKADRCMSAASAKNEGKLHLGYVYGNDPSLRTARTMLRGALAFGPLLRRWLGDAVDRIPVSTPFLYAVHAGSLRSPDQCADHLAATRRLAVVARGEGRLDYFGSDPTAAPVRMANDELEDCFDARNVQAAFRTPEIAIDPGALAEVVRARLHDDPLIGLHKRTTVLAAVPSGRGIAVEVDGPGGADRLVYDHAVNALWEGRFAVDLTAGVEPERPWLHRVKHYVRIDGPGVSMGIPSVTVVLGPYGDTVAYRDGLYLSWYPAGMRGASPDLVPPAWPIPLGEPEASDLRQGTVEGLASIVPAIGRLPAEAMAGSRVDGGHIVAWGQTDIGDPSSGLHERYEIGPRSYGRYHSVETGKLTTAPLYGKILADRIIAIG